MTVFYQLMLFTSIALGLICCFIIYRRPIRPVVLLIDCSGSTQGDINCFLKKALSRFLAMTSSPGNAFAKIRLAVFAFNYGCREVKLENGVVLDKEITALGGTDIGLALENGIARLEQQYAALKSSRRRILPPLLLLATDGEMTSHNYNLIELRRRLKCINATCEVVTVYVDPKKYGLDLGCRASVVLPSELPEKFADLARTALQPA